MTNTKTLIPLGDSWILMVFFEERKLTVTLESVGSSEDWRLHASEISVDNPPKLLNKWLSEIDFDRLVDEANLQAHHLIQQPQWQAVEWKRKLQSGKRTPPSLLRQIVKMRSTMSVIEISRELDKSRAQVYRYLEQAEELGYLPESEGEH